MCPTCSAIPKNPVCGLTNNKEYDNECLLRRDECLVKTEIGTTYKPCKGKKKIILVRFLSAKEIIFLNKNFSTLLPETFTEYIFTCFTILWQIEKTNSDEIW